MINIKTRGVTMDYANMPTASYKRISTQKIISELLEKHKARCAYCGISVVFGQLELDAYLPLHTHPDVQVSDNYVLSCAHCNRIKGGKEPIAEDGQVIILHPYSDRYWNEIKIDRAGVAEGVTEAGRSTINHLQLNRPELVSYRKDHIADYIEKINDGNSAFDVYQCSIKQIKELLQIVISNSDLQKYFYQMIYANVIATMEAYLSKCIISLVLNDDTMFWRFVRRFDWGKEKINIEDIKDVYDSMNIKVQTKLTEVLYHNLPKVKAMYKNILEIDILRSDADMTFLTQAVDIRHDLVHRNGRKGKHCEVDVFHDITLEMITELIEHVDSLVEDIENQKDS